MPLLKVVLSPFKADAATTAILALTKIGKPAIQPTIALLQGDQKELVEYSKVENLKGAGGDKASAEQKKAAETAHVAAAALVLATIGRQESSQPLLAALEKAEDVPRAIIARELTKVPRTPETPRGLPGGLRQDARGARDAAGRHQRAGDARRGGEQLLRREPRAVAREDRPRGARGGRTTSRRSATSRCRRRSS